MDIDSYCLPDWSSASNQSGPPILKPNQSKSAKPPSHTSISTKHRPINHEFPQPNEKEQITRTLSAREPQSNVIEESIRQFIPRSTSGRMSKEKINEKKKRILPAIKLKNDSGVIIGEETIRSRVGSILNLPIACPNIIRQRFIQDGPVSPIVYDTCTCRTDHVPFIHDLELDTFLQLTSELNARQLVVIGIINSNLSQMESEELIDILRTLHNHLNYGRSQICLCRLSTSDDYRCLIYDLSQATKQSSFYGPLLVRRHHVQPGFVLIYQHGQLIFGDSIFNGYGTSVQDLKKQLNQMRQQQMQQIALPQEFKFLSDHRRTNPTVLRSI